MESHTFRTQSIQRAILVGRRKSASRDVRDMNAKNLTLAVSILLTMAFASLSAVEHSEVGASTTTTQTVVTSISYTVTVTETENQTTGQGLSYLSFMGNQYGCSLGASRNSTFYTSPCFGSLQNAVVFNCAAQANTSQGCTLRISTTVKNESFTVTVWYPYLNSSQGFFNCKFVVPSIPLPGHDLSYAECIPLGGNSFLIAVPFHPLPV